MLKALHNVKCWTLVLTFLGAVYNPLHFSSLFYKNEEKCTPVVNRPLHFSSLFYKKVKKNV